MSEKFDPSRLKLSHNRHTSDFIRDRDKAIEMAEEEKQYRELAALYNEYEYNPASFSAKHPDVGADQLALFDELKNAGITHQYILRYGELRAELEGNIHDFAVRIRHYSDYELLWLKHGLDLLTAAQAIVLPPGRNVDYSLRPAELNVRLQLSFNGEKLKAIAREMDRRASNEVQRG